MVCARVIDVVRWPHADMKYESCRGHSFFALNEELLELYAACTNAEQVIQAQNSYLESMAEQDRQNAARAEEHAGDGYLDGLDLPPSDDDSYSSSEEDATTETELCDTLASVHV